MADDVRVPIDGDEDMVPARAAGRALALELGFTRTDASLIATASSEVARNIVVHARRGELVMTPIREEYRCGLVVVARDEGNGLPDGAEDDHELDVTQGLGLGLAGARSLMDDFAVDASPGRGTTITMTKWRVRDELERLRAKRRGDAL
jgi:serine/threonine-protein kinase RsbT